MAASIEKLTHWGLDAYFYSHAAIKMSPDGQQPPLPIEAPPAPSTNRNLAPNSVKFAMWVIGIIAVVYASYLHSKVGLIERENAVLKEASSVTRDPVTTTLFSTYTATSISTATSVSTATTTLTVANKWFFVGDSSVPSEPSEQTHLPWESIDDPPPAFTNTPSATPEPEHFPSKNSVFEPSNNPSPWSSIKLPSSEEMTEHVRWAIVKLWKVVLKVYHYPLDPP